MGRPALLTYIIPKMKLQIAPRSNRPGQKVEPTKADMLTQYILEAVLEALEAKL